LPEECIPIDDSNIVTEMNMSQMAVQKQMAIHQEDDVNLCQPPTYNYNL